MGARASGTELKAARAVLATSKRSASLSAWLDTTLAAIEQHLDYRRSSLLVALTADGRSVPRAFAGTTRGWEAEVLVEYFERWADSDPLAGRAARDMFAREGFASTAALAEHLDAPQRRFVDQFLASIGVTDQLSLRLRGNGTTDGYLTLHEPTPIGATQRQRLEPLAAALARQLRGFLPAGLAGSLSLRERQAAELVAFGFANHEIASVMCVGPDTVKKHLFRATKKLGLSRRTELAVAWATGRPLPRPLLAPDGRHASPS